MLTELSFRHDFQLVRVVRVADIHVAWLVYVRTYCVPIAASSQNKRSRLLFLGNVPRIIYCVNSKLKTPHSQECPCHVTHSLVSFNEHHGQKYLSRTCLPIPINISILCVPFMGWLAQKLCFSVPCTHQLTQVHLYLSFLFIIFYFSCYLKI